MEHIVHFHVHGQLKPVGNITHLVEHLEGANKLGHQLWSPRCKHCKVPCIQQHKVTHVKLHVTTVQVCIRLLALLCALQARLGYCHGLMHQVCNSLCTWHLAAPRQA